MGAAFRRTLAPLTTASESQSRAAAALQISARTKYSGWTKRKHEILILNGSSAPSALGFPLRKGANLGPMTKIQSASKKLPHHQNRNPNLEPPRWPEPPRHGDPVSSPNLPAKSNSSSSSHYHCHHHHYHHHHHHHHHHHLRQLEVPEPGAVVAAEAELAVQALVAAEEVEAPVWVQAAEEEAEAPV
jgi:hypothetical protein